MTEHATVKCVDCGFYSRRRIDTEELICADEAYRVEPTFSINDERATCHQMPICAMGVSDFWSEGDLQEAVTRERACKQFVRWIPALTPREHAAMIRDERRDLHTIVIAVAGIAIGSLVTLAATRMSPPPIINVLPAPIQAQSK